MRIGLTYDLRQDYLSAGYSLTDTAEFDRPDTIEAIARALKELGHEPVRIGNIHALVRQLASGQRWDLVFNIAEGLHGFGREAQVPAVLDAYQIAYTFSDPLSCALTLHKAMAKQIVRGAGVLTPEFALIEQIADIDKITGNRGLAFPLFAKPVAEGTSKGISAASKVNSHSELKAVCAELLGCYRQPVLVEAFLPGREFTAGITGTGADAAVAGVLEVKLRPDAEADVYSYMNKECYQQRVDYRLESGPLAGRIGAVALAAWRALACRDGGRIDIRLDSAGRVHFLEANPLPGLHPEHSDLPILCTLAGIGYAELIARILESALSRCASQHEPAASVKAVA